MQNGAIPSALVTGGGGFIGSHIVDALLAAGSRVTVLDNFSTGRRANLAHVADRIRLVEGDIRDGAVLADAMDGCRAVFHLAAVVSVPQTVAEPLESDSVNDAGTLQVLETARQGGVGRVVLSSSCAVYGDTPELPKSEDLLPRPQTPYAVQKLAGEHYARVYFELYGLEAVALRYFNVYGPRQDPSSPYSGVISIFMDHAAEGRAPVIHGDGRQYRDFVYVADVVAANLRAAAGAGAPGGCFNIGTGRFVRIAELWERIGALAGCRLPARFGPPREGDIRRSVADIGRTADRLGYAPTIDIDQGLARTFDWYRRSGAAQPQNPPDAPAKGQAG